MAKISYMACAAALLLGGCTTYSLEELRRAEPAGSDFQKALARQYLAFADVEAKAYDWVDSAYFADKGLAAAYGHDVAPEEVSGWSIPDSLRPAMEEARAALTEALNHAGEKPEAAARAQLNFDCWLEQQEENWQDDDIAHCRDGFADAMAALSGAPPEADATMTENGEALVDTVSYIVFFEGGSSVMTFSGKRVVDEVVESLENETDYEIILNGHSDTAGSERYNLKLSERRADAVRQRLTQGGVHEDAIKIFAYGESDPPVKTADGVSEPANRRVEIFLQ